LADGKGFIGLQSPLATRVNPSIATVVVGWYKISATMSFAKKFFLLHSTERRLGYNAANCGALFLFLQCVFKRKHGSTWYLSLVLMVQVPN